MIARISLTLLVTLCTLGYLILHTDAQTETQIRGIKRRDIPRYSGATFTCLNGVGTIPSSQLNDDYCDCADGSDEPGTSACLNGHFWCVNKGAKGKLLPSSRVRDGVCDCCDGSDEQLNDGTSICKNQCEESGRAAREAALAEIAATEGGLIARSALVTAAQEVINQRRTKYLKYEKLLEARKIKLDVARALKEQEEAIEQAERTRIQTEREAAQAAAGTTETPAAAIETAATTEPAATEAAPATPTPAATPAAEESKENFPYPPEYAYHAMDAADKKVEEKQENFPYPAEYAFKAEGSESDHEEGGMIEPEYAEDGEGDEQDSGAEDDEDEDDAGTVHPDEAQVEEPYVHQGASTTTTTTTTATNGKPTPIEKVKAAIAKSASDLQSASIWTFIFWTDIYTVSLAWTLAAYESLAINVKDLFSGKFDVQQLLSRWGNSIKAVLESIGERTLDTIAWCEKTAFGTNTTAVVREVPSASDYLHPGAEKAREEFTKIETKVNKLQKKMDDLKNLLDRDYGKEKELLHMDGKCFDLPIKQYTYEVCPYVNAKQKEGSSSTSLGNWGGIDVTPLGETILKFSGGQTCWQGPARSLTVRLRCGQTDRLLSVDEPSKCVYEMAMETPAVCNAQHAQILRMNLESGGLIEEEEEE